jgi:hypothetical protein
MISAVWRTRAGERGVRAASTPGTDGGAGGGGADAQTPEEEQDERAPDFGSDARGDGVPTTRLLVLQENGHPRTLAQPSPLTVSSPASVSTPAAAPPAAAPAASPAAAPAAPIIAEPRRRPKARRQSRSQATHALPAPPPLPLQEPLVDYGADFSDFPNVNPLMDGLGTDVRVMNALDVPLLRDSGGSTPSLDQLFPANMGFLESMPTTGMFDWGTRSPNQCGHRALTA